MVRLTLIVWIGSAILIAGAIGWGQGYERVKTDKLQALNLDTCNGNPCFMNITPGITRWKTAETLLAKWDVMNAYDTLIVSLDNVETRVWPSFDRSKVSVISVRRRPNMAVSTLGDVILHYGAPCWVRLTGRYESLLLYPRISVTIALLRGRLSASSPVYDIQLVEPSLLFKSPPDLCRNIDETTGLRWAGFASLASYEARALPIQ